MMGFVSYDADRATTLKQVASGWLPLVVTLIKRGVARCAFVGTNTTWQGGRCAFPRCIPLFRVVDSLRPGPGTCCHE